MKPDLVIMAAGMGSRFGGPKQITPVDDAGQVILDYSAFDAVRAGFGRILCVVRRDTEADFREAVGNRLARGCDVYYAYQDAADLPAGFSVPEGRIKPWGTGHAVRACRAMLDRPFAVINSDDFYGPGAFRALAEHLTAPGPDNEHVLVTYRLRNCLTENGTVARGICDVDGEGQLLSVTERTKVSGPADAPSYEEDGVVTPLAPDTPVSLNTWGFRPSFVPQLEEEFERFLRRDVPANPLKAEFYLPFAVNDRLQAGELTVRAALTDETWYGVTYREDLPRLVQSLRALRESGLYPERLWER